MDWLSEIEIDGVVYVMRSEAEEAMLVLENEQRTWKARAEKAEKELDRLRDFAVRILG
jgi:hypothetical protein